MCHACQRFWHCYRTLTFCSLLARCRIPYAKRHPNVQKLPDHGLFLAFWLRNVVRATTACTFSTFQLPKVLRHWSAFCISTSTCASRNSGVRFFNITPSKVLRAWCVFWCFLHFDFQMCFAPQRRTLFQHLNFQKCSDVKVFLFILPWKCASCHNGMQFFISHPAKWLRTRFSERTLRPSGTTNHWKNTLFRDFSRPFRAPAPSFFWSVSSLVFSLLPVSSLTLPTSAFHLSILSEVWFLNFHRLYFKLFQ